MPEMVLIVVGLTGAIAAQQRDDLAIVDIQAHIHQRLKVAIIDTDVTHFKHTSSPPNTI